MGDNLLFQRLWRFPFRDGLQRFRTRSIIILCLYLICFHILSVLLARYLGTWNPLPGHDHTPSLNQVLDHGYPTFMHVPPGFSYYLALKVIVTQWLGLPYYSAKYFIDVFMVLLTVLLSFRLAWLLTRNRTIALISALGLVHTPIYILGVGYEESAIFFLPFFLATLIVFVKECQRPDGIRFSVMFIAGVLNGLATLIRGNTQYLFLALAAFLLLITGWKQFWSKLRMPLYIGTFLLAQFVVMSPWIYVMRQQGRDGLSALPSVYMSYFDGLRRHRGNEICEWILLHYEEPERSLRGVIDFNLYWLKTKPYAFFELYFLKYFHAWYISESGRWDMATLYVHLPIWIVALFGIWRWRRTARGDPAYLFLFCVIFYMWTIASIMGGIARYSSPLYGMVCIFVGVFAITIIPRLALSMRKHEEAVRT